VKKTQNKSYYGVQGHSRSSRSVPSDYRFKIGDFDPVGAGWPQISRRRDRPPPTIFLLRKL